MLDKKRLLLVFGLLILMLACQVIPTPPSLTPTVPFPETPAVPHVGQATPGGPLQPTLPGGGSPDATPANNPAAVPVGLYDFSPAQSAAFLPASLPTWEAGTFKGADYTLPLDLEQLANLSVTTGMTKAQLDFLQNNGFVVMRSQEAQFSDIHQQVAAQDGQPYYLTTDAAYHTLHINLDELFVALEREELHPRMIAVLQAMMDEVLNYWVLVQNTPLQGDTALAAAYLGTALKLFDPQIALDTSLEALIAPQINQVLTVNGRARSALIPNFEDDYSAYQPVGHYAGDTQLENYFRGMTWLGRVQFNLQDDDPTFQPSRAPLILTLALRRAQTESGPAGAQWQAADEVFAFLVGPRDDAGPYEYAALMDQVYGPYHTIIGLQADGGWGTFRDLARLMPASRLNSTFVDSSAELVGLRGWRLMGQRFSLDGYIFQNLIHDKVGTPERRRDLPSGLDIMAVLGSQPALQTLDEMGVRRYQNYDAQMTVMQQMVTAQPEGAWFGTAYNTWLYTILSQLSLREDAYPTYMRTPGWAYKDLNSALGSWAELKRDTVLYVKMPEAMGGGGPPTSGPAPAYVEPNPVVFYRLAYLARAVAQGLAQRSMSGRPSEDTGELTLQMRLDGMQELSDDFSRLGDIAVKELAGEPLNESERWLVQAPLGLIERQVWRARRSGQSNGPQMPPIPLIAAVSGAGDQVLQVGVGPVNRIYVVLPLDGKLQAAQGGVFSYYEFAWPRNERLTDQAWNNLLNSERNSPALPTWAANFVLPGGHPVEYTAFRLGDVYILTPAGGRLNLRAEPERRAEVLGTLEAGAYLLIVDGPVEADGAVWWKVQVDAGLSEGALEGWMVEDQQAYERAWGQ